MSVKAGALAIAIAALAGGCGKGTECSENCPAVGDSFSLDYTTILGSCQFTPLIIPPTLQITQAGNSGRALVSVVDPVNQVPVNLAATIFEPESGKAVATLHSLTRIQRQTALGSARFADLQIEFNATITESSGVRHITGQLLTIDLTTQPPDNAAESGCQVITQFVGTGGRTP